MRPNYQTTCERDPACWEIRCGHQRDFFHSRNVPTGRIELVIMRGVRFYGRFDGTETSLDHCSCRAFGLANECRHVAIVQAILSFLAREAEKQSTSAEERRE